MTFPDTNEKLIAILQNAENQDAWSNFVLVYEVAIHEFAKSKGFSTQDAEDITQNVLVSVAKSISQWKPDPTRGRFRTWVCTIANRKIIDIIRKRQLAHASGRTSVIEALHSVPERLSDSQLLKMEIRRQLFRQAAEAVRTELSPDAWDAFWMTAVEEIPPKQVAKTLQKSVGAVYAAKGRAMKRITEYVRQLESEISYEVGDVEVKIE